MIILIYKSNSNSQIKMTQHIAYLFGLGVFGFASYKLMSQTSKEKYWEQYFSKYVDKQTRNHPENMKMQEDILKYGNSVKGSYKGINYRMERPLETYWYGYVEYKVF